MKIVKLKAENIKKLIAVEIAPNGNLVKITGKNASGKTSVLDSIWWGLGGSQNIQDEPIRKGEKKASIEIDLGEMVVKRTFNEGGTTALNIENKDGLRFKSPQTLLDGLLGKLSFDPLEFMRQEPRKQFETLRTLTGVDLSKLDAMRQKTYDERASLNRLLKTLEVKVEGATVPKAPEPFDGEEVDVSELAGKMAEAVKLRDRYQKIEDRIENGMDDIRVMEATIKDLEERLAHEKSALEEERLAVKTCQEERSAITVPDIAALQSELKEAEEKNKAVRLARKNFDDAMAVVLRAREQRESLHKELEATKKDADTLTEKLEAIDAEKQSMIAQANFPLEGLGFGNGAVTYSGLPLAQASSAEQLRVSMAMAMSLNPKLKVIRITDGSLLDSSSMKIVEEMANGSDYQVWVEVVDESGKVGVVIEDGQVASIN